MKYITDMHETVKYIYTTEVVVTPVTRYQVKLVSGLCCNVYHSEQEAMAAVPELVKLWRSPFLRLHSYDTDEVEVHHHRYKKR